MLHQLISLNADLKRLWDEGFEIEIKYSHLFIHNIPYLNSKLEIRYGTLVSVLDLSGDRTVRPSSHTCYFIGEKPCHPNGKAMSEIINNSNVTTIAGSTTVNHFFSSKPKIGYYKDYYEKMNSYSKLLSSQAESIDDSVTAKSFKRLENNDNSVFNYIDTNSSRAGISAISNKLGDQRIAIIGVGGTGSYVLDLLCKNPVKEIQIFDKDVFLSHNAFRSPGAARLQKLRDRPLKVEYFKELYSNMHKNIVANNVFVDKNNAHLLKGFDFIFICIDDGASKKHIIDYLINLKKPFVDVGIGILNSEGKLTGSVRTTYGYENNYNHIFERISFANNDKDDYSTNIQISDLNALNASLAVITWKRRSGFYHDFKHEKNSSYRISTNSINNEDHDI